MTDIATLRIASKVVAAAADRAKQQGLTTEDFVMQVLLRELETDPNERSLLAYDAADPASDFVIERGSDESAEDYEARSSTLNRLFPKR